jgi:hypothetical protein
MKRFILERDGSRGVFQMPKLPKDPSTVELPEDSLVQTIHGSPESFVGHTVCVSWAHEVQILNGDGLPVFIVVKA